MVKKKNKKSVSKKIVKKQSSKKKKQLGARELAFFKSIILEKQKDTLENLEALKSYIVDPDTGEYNNEISSYSLHMEQGTDSMEREKTFLFAARDTKLLSYLREAIQRIDSKTYGVCTVCGNQIEKARLIAVPITQLCVKCKLKKNKPSRKPQN